jgi:hypothetical protein
MGGDAMYRTIQRTTATGAAFAVALALASFADPEGWCFPSLTKLARRARCSRKTAIRSIKALVAAGEVEVHARAHDVPHPAQDAGAPGGFQSTNYYRIVHISRVRTGATGRVKVTPPSALQGGDIQGGQVVTSRASLSSVRINKSKEQVRVPAPSRDLTGLKSEVRSLLLEDPELGGEDLLKAVERRTPDDDGQPRFTLDEYERGIEECLAEAKEKSNSPLSLIAVYSGLFTRHLRVRSNIGDNDGKRLEQLARTHGEARVRELLDWFFRTRDPFVRQSGYTVGVFCSCFNKLLLSYQPAKDPALSETRATARADVRANSARRRREREDQAREALAALQGAARERLRQKVVAELEEGGFRRGTMKDKDFDQAVENGLVAFVAHRLPQRDETPAEALDRFNRELAA